MNMPKTNTEKIIDLIEKIPSDDFYEHKRYIKNTLEETQGLHNNEFYKLFRTRLVNLYDSTMKRGFFLNRYDTSTKVGELWINNPMLKKVDDYDSTEYDREYEKFIICYNDVCSLKRLFGVHNENTQLTIKTNIEMDKTEINKTYKSTLKSSIDRLMTSWFLYSNEYATKSYSTDFNL